jgi:ribonuclease HII
MSKKQALKTSYSHMQNVLEIGIDEAGRGPLFGRVYSAGVILPKDNFKFELLKDSKKFTSKKKIEEVANYIKENAIAYSVEYEDEKSIDKNNIRIATLMAMHKAIKNIIEANKNDLSAYFLLVDGRDFKPITYLNNEDTLEEIKYICIEGGDNKYCAIAAASILAKVERDKYIHELCSKYEKLQEYYELNNNKGYGTKKHMDGIREHGITPWHRKSFGLCATAHINEAFTNTNTNT